MPELLWNCFVYITPLPIISILEHYSSSPLSTQAHNIDPMQPLLRTHEQKSDVLRGFFGLSRRSWAFHGVRRMPGIATILKDDRSNHPPGLGNWDNSCYQNSIIQGLASLRSLSNFLKTAAIVFKSSPGFSSTSTVQALLEITNNLNDRSNNGLRFWTPPKLKSMSSWQQQDAQEYFSKVLDAVDKDVANAWNKASGDDGLCVPPLPEIFPTRMLDSEDTRPESFSINTRRPKLPLALSRASLSDELSQLQQPQWIKNPLEGFLAQRVGCLRCGYSEGLSLIPFNCITVPIGGDWYYDIRELLDEFSKLELIEGVECGKCTLLRSQAQLRRLLEPAETIVQSVQPQVSDSLRVVLEARLEIIDTALAEDDYEESTLVNKCKIPPKNRVKTTKSRQAVIIRPPESLVIHVNRSVFDERTGELKKNYAKVKFENILNLGPWCMGNEPSASGAEEFMEWNLDPTESMIAGSDGIATHQAPCYELRAVVTHYGRHENGHYICYRKHSYTESHHPVSLAADSKSVDCKPKSAVDTAERWWRISDDDVMPMKEDMVMAQGGVFMLFYDRVNAQQQSNG
ncbi:MAG: hypothetical protein M1829_004226 [Trizodia sp. TS-e1964]|nr:MAG: hypothetical protein M1829_004226 [Trizodia sp. TS-e1964]